MTEFVIGGITYRHEPDGTEYQYIGPDNVRYRKHRNGGGLVAASATVEDTVYVGPVARVFGNATLRDRVRLTGRAQVGGMVHASGDVTFAGRIPTTEGEYGGKRIVMRKSA